MYEFDTTTGQPRPVVHLSQLVRRPVVARSGETVGGVDDVVVRLHGTDAYPLVTGVVMTVGGRRVYVPAAQVDRIEPDRVLLAGERVDLRGFEVAGLIVGVLLVLSGILMATTLFPDLDIVSVAVWLGVAVAVLVGVTILALRLLGHGQEQADRSTTVPVGEKDTWRMPPLALLQPVCWFAGTKLGMLALRGYLMIGAILLVVKAVQIGGGW